MVSVLQMRSVDDRDDFFSSAFQQDLARWNRDRLAPRFPTADWRSELRADAQMEERQVHFLQFLRAEVAARAAQAPTEPAAFIAWFDSPLAIM